MLASGDRRGGCTLPKLFTRSRRRIASVHGVRVFYFVETSISLKFDEAGRTRIRPIVFEQQKRLAFSFPYFIVSIYQVPNKLLNATIPCGADFITVVGLNVPESLSPFHRMYSALQPNRSSSQQTHVLQARRRELRKVHASIRQGDEVRLLSRIRRETGIVRVAPLRRHSRDHAAFGHAFGPALKDIPIQRGQQPVHVLVFHGARAPGHGIHQRVPRPQYGLDDTPPVCQLLSGQLVCRPLFSEVRDNLLHDQRTALRIGAGINAVLLGDGCDFRIAHAAHAPPQPVEHTPFLVLSQKPVQAVVHHVLVHPHFRRACRTAQIVRHEVHRAGSGIVHPLQTRRHLAVKLPDMLGKFLKRLNHPRIGGVGRPFSERVRDGLHSRLAHAEARGRHFVQKFAGVDGSHRRFFGIRLLGRFRQLLLDLKHPLTGILKLLLLLKRTFQLFLKRRYLGLGAFDLRRVLGGASRVPGQIVLEAREQARSPVEGA